MHNTRTACLHHHRRSSCTTEESVVEFFAPITFAEKAVNKFYGIERKINQMVLCHDAEATNAIQ